MQAEFFVSQIYNLGGTGIILHGEISSGQVAEGSIGMTFSGKKFTVVRIERQGERVLTANKKDKVNIFIKNIEFSDLRIGETLYLM